MNGLGQSFDDFLKDEGVYDEVMRMTDEKVASLERRKGIFARLMARLKGSMQQMTGYGTAGGAEAMTR